jgi:hypothetical protein
MTVTAALYGTLVLASWAIARLPAFAPAGIANSAAALPIENRAAPSRSAAAEFANAPQAAAMGNTAVANNDVATAAEAVTGTANDAAVVPEQPKSIVAAASPDLPLSDLPLSDLSSPDLPQMPPHETPPVQVATLNTPDPGPDEITEAASRAALPDQCGTADSSCIDRYLWALYQRTPKENAIKVPEQRQVTVKKKGKMVTVTRTFTRLVDEDFAWKDPKAAEKVGMPMMDYVIGGMDPTFKLKLFQALRAAEQAGLSPGITSAFRDDYRQSIASGLKAASDRSYHGGSSRGGYGHGLAADVVSVKGATRQERWTSTESFWKWIDAHGNEFGIGRPYLGRDPPHVAPIDGKEYVSRRGTTTVQYAQADSKKRTRVAARVDHHAAKTPAPKKRKVAALQRS